MRIYSINYIVISPTLLKQYKYEAYLEDDETNLYTFPISPSPVIEKYGDQKVTQVSYPRLLF